jgi:hypothetical protein
LIEGYLPRRALELVLDWAEIHKAELIEDWQLCYSKQQPRIIGGKMYFDVIEAKVIGNLSFKIRFEDGTAGIVKFKPEHLTGVFEPLKNPQFFFQLFINNGTVTWPNEIDLAPDAMYTEIKKHGEWILS